MAAGTRGRRKSIRHGKAKGWGSSTIKGRAQIPNRTQDTRVISRTASRTPCLLRKRFQRAFVKAAPGASHENAKAPLKITKPPADSDRRRKSSVSGGGGKRDSHHTHEPERKGGGTRPARSQRQSNDQKAGDRSHAKTPNLKARGSEFPVSSGGSHQESRDHNKHNDPGQSGHKPQEPSSAQEKT